MAPNGRHRHVGTSRGRELDDGDDGGSTDVGIQFGKSFDRDVDPDSPTGANAAFPDDRGLCFLCYQSSIKDKFEFLMRFWVNNESFPRWSRASRTATIS
jgi:hypothetical protein